MKLIDEYLKTIERELGASKIDLKSSEQGVVTEIKDGVIILQGLDNATYGELLEFDNNCLAYVIDLSEENVGAIVLGDYLSIRSGTKARALGRSLSIPVSDELLGRIIDPLGASLDNGVKIKTDLYFPVEKVAPGVVMRQPVSVPVQTGIKAIDSLIPIGRGQRELIIGDRGTGKTTIAVDTILNQKNEN